MKRASLWIVVLGLVGALQALPATAYPDCASHCTVNTSCEDECLAGEGKGEGEPVTCGEYGVCEGAPQPPCTPNWVVISSQPIGGFAQQSFFPPGCDYYGVSRLTWHDTSQCGDPDYQTCSITFHTFRSDGACCVYYWCGGDTCGFN